MLVLTRCLGEKLFIEHNGNVIEVCLTQIKGKQIRLGINAPRTVNIKNVHENSIKHKEEASGMAHDMEKKRLMNLIRHIRES